MWVGKTRWGWVDCLVGGWGQVVAGRHLKVVRVSRPSHTGKSRAVNESSTN